jgi:hypothetical protein
LNDDRIPLTLIKSELQSRIEPLVRELLPHGRRVTNRWEAVNPTRADKSSGSFFVWLRGPAAGAWKDYASDDKGDVIDLVRYVQGGDRGDAIRWAQGWLGLSGPVDRATRERMKADADAKRAAARKEQARADELKRRRAFNMWLSAERSITGTPVEAYLASRKIMLADIPNPEKGELRYAPALEWWKGAKWSELDASNRRHKLEPGPRFPAMVAAIRNAAGEVTAVHCTFLARDGSAKADVEKAES